MRRAHGAGRRPSRPAAAWWLLAALLAAALPAAAVEESPGPGGAEIRAREPPADPGSVILAGLPPDLARRLHEDHVVLLEPEQRGAPDERQLVRGLVIFEQPRERTYLFLAQTERQGEYRTDLKRVRTVRRHAHGVVDEHLMKIMLIGITYRVRYEMDAEAGTIRWELDPDFEGGLRGLEGYWELYELDQHRTLARFGTRVDAGPALPDFLQDYATRKNLPRTLERVRRWVDSGGRWRP